MINLLPPEIKKEYRYARYNQKFLIWSILLIFTIAGIWVITASGLIVMNNSINTSNKNIGSINGQLNTQNVAKVKSQVTDITKNITLLEKVLSREILYSKMLTKLGSITPSNVILTNLTISSTEKAIELSAQSRDYNSATQLQVNLADPTNQIFTNADIENITCSSANSAVKNPNYPCTVTIKAQFTKNNPFLFINSKGTST